MIITLSENAHYDTAITAALAFIIYNKLLTGMEEGIQFRGD